MKKPRISVVIPSYRQKDTINRTIESLLEQDFDDYEIIIVDSSNDETTNIIKSYIKKSDKIKIIERDVKTLCGMQRNIGIRRAKGEIIATTDTDCVLSSDWLQNIQKSVSDEYPVVGGSFGNANPTSVVGWIGYILEFNHFFPGNPKKQMNFIAGGNLAFKKEIPEKYGFFPETQYGEDMILTSKWFQKGITFLFNPKIRVNHINRSKISELLKNQFNLGRGSATVRKSGFAFKKEIIKFPFLFPFLWLYRYLSIFYRLIRWNQKHFLVFLFLTPFILPTLFLWNIGFVMGYFFPIEIKTF